MCTIRRSYYKQTTWTFCLQANSYVIVFSSLSSNLTYWSASRKQNERKKTSNNNIKCESRDKNVTQWGINQGRLLHTQFFFIHSSLSFSLRSRTVMCVRLIWLNGSDEIVDRAKLYEAIYIYFFFSLEQFTVLVWVRVLRKCRTKISNQQIRTVVFGTIQSQFIY